MPTEMTIFVFVLYLALTTGISTEKSHRKCDMMLWYLRMSRNGVFDKALSADQEALKADIENMMKDTKSHSTKRADCAVLAMYEEELLQDYTGENENSHDSSQEDTKDEDTEQEAGGSAILPTESADETDLTDLDSDEVAETGTFDVNDITHENRIVSTSEIPDNTLYRPCKNALTTPNLYRDIITSKKQSSSLNFHLEKNKKMNMAEVEVSHSSNDTEQSLQTDTRQQSPDKSYAMHKQLTKTCFSNLKKECYIICYYNTLWFVISIPHYYVSAKQVQTEADSQIVRAHGTTHAHMAKKMLFVNDIDKRTINAQEVTEMPKLKHILADGGKTQNHFEKKAPQTETPIESKHANSENPIFQAHMRTSQHKINKEVDDNANSYSGEPATSLNTNDVSDTASKSEFGSPELASREQALFEKVSNMIGERENEYRLKLKNMEITIMRLENQLLVERVHKQNDTSVLLRLENQILKMENDFLRLNQKYEQMVEENTYLKQRQAHYNELEQERAYNTSKYLSLAYDKQSELANQHETRLLQLNKLLENQNSVIQNLKGKAAQCDSQINRLFGVIQNQTKVIANIKNKTELMDKQQKEQNVVNEKLNLKLQESVLATSLRESVEQLLSDRLSSVHKEIRAMCSAASNTYKQSFKNIKLRSRSNWCTGLPRGQKVFFVMLQKCKSYVLPSSSMGSPRSNLIGNVKKEVSKNTSGVSQPSRSNKQDTHKPSNVRVNKKLLKLVNDFRTCSKVGLFVSRILNLCDETHCSKVLLEIFPALCHVTKLHPYCMTRVRRKPQQSLVIDKQQNDAAGVLINEQAPIPSSQTTPGKDKEKFATSKRLDEQVNLSTGEHTSAMNNKEPKMATDGNIYPHRGVKEGTAPEDVPSGAGKPSSKITSDSINPESENKKASLDVIDNKTGVLNQKDAVKPLIRPGMSEETVHLTTQESLPKTPTNTQNKTQSKPESGSNRPGSVVPHPPKQPTARIPPLYDSTKLREPKDCYDHLKEGKIRDGSFTVMLASYKRAKVYCDMKNGGWTLLQKRSDGTTDFFKNWQKYKDGFGSKHGEHWLGNDPIHHLTNQDHYELRIEMTDWNKNKKYAQYEYFRVGSEKQGYPLHIEGYSGDAGDGLAKHNGMKFSTKDVDNDQVVKEFDGSCAKRFNGAWWYYRCYSSNLNGKYYRGGKVAEKAFDGIAWKPWTGPNYSLRTVVMKIRPRITKRPE